jgi:hypothetical protein
MPVCRPGLASRPSSNRCNLYSGRFCDLQVLVVCIFPTIRSLTPVPHKLQNIIFVSAIEAESAEVVKFIFAVPILFCISPGHFSHQLSFVSPLKRRLTYNNKGDSFITEFARNLEKSEHLLTWNECLREGPFRVWPCGRREPHLGRPLRGHRGMQVAS